MPAKKKQAIDQPAQTEQAPCPIPAFSLLTTGFASAQKAEQRMRSAALPEASPAIQAAWSSLVSERNIALLGLMEEEPGRGSLFFSSIVERDVPGQRNGHRYALPFAGYDGNALAELAAGLRELTQEVREIASTESFAQAAETLAPLVVSPASSVVLAYPLLSYGLKHAATKTEAGKRFSLSGAPLVSGDEEKMSAPQSASDRSKRLLVHGQSLLSPEEIKEASDLAKDLKPLSDYRESLRHAYTSPDMDLLAPPALHASLGLIERASLIGETPLPAIQAIETAALESKNSPGMSVLWTKPHNSPSGMDTIAGAARVAAERLRQGALSALSAAMAPAKAGSFDLAEREARCNLLRGPCSQISVGAHDKKGATPLFQWIAAAPALYYAIYESATPQQKGDDSFADNPERIATWLQGAAATPELLSKTLARAAELGSRPIDPVQKKQRANFQGPRNWGGASAYPNAPVSVGPQGLLGLSGARAELARANPRVGLAQWAGRAIQLTIKSEENLYNKAPDGELLFELHPDAQARRDLLAALRAYSLELKHAGFVFTQKTLAKARETERQWLAGHSLDKAWEQAHALGAATQKSLLWALDNPMSESLSSANPLARMAAACARTLGIRGGSDEQMVQSLQEELDELGLNAEGFALLTQSEEARAALTPLISGASGKGKQKIAAYAVGMGVACKALSAAAAEGLSGAEAALLATTLGDPDRYEQRFGRTRRALEQGFSPINVGSAAGAQVVAELARAKNTHQASLYRALARDWRVSRETGSAAGMDNESSLAETHKRFSTFHDSMPHSLSVDWRKEPFKGREAWEIFGVSSPRLASTLAAARAEGGLALWSAGLAESFEIKDAHDSNDLIGQCKQGIKNLCGLTDGAWKMAIKSPEMLQMLSQSAQEAKRNHWNPWKGRDSEIEEGFLVSSEDKAAIDGADESGRFDTLSTRQGLALNIAVSQNLNPESAAQTLSVFNDSSRSTLLFSQTIDDIKVDTAEGADFYRQESLAKSSRMPKVFKEACKRFEKLAKDRADAEAKGIEELPLAAPEALASEISDLVDWLAGSEYGVWQTLPEEPTWGQLARLSRAWHDERAAIEADRLSRVKAAEQERELEHKLAPFAPRSTEHWAPVMGAYQRDGWEAVELTSQSQLSEEGTAMAHCVSGYSSYCREGYLRIFSIRLNGERKCTMELRAKNQKPLGQQGEQALFSITQNKGRHNAAVTNKALREFCEEVNQVANASWSVKWRETQALVAEEKERKRLADQKAKQALAAQDGGAPSEPALASSAKKAKKK